jgi:4'-phosphopantetheinyl transferase
MILDRFDAAACFLATDDVVQGRLLHERFDLLGQEERRRATAFRQRADRDAFVAAHALARFALQALVGGRPEEWLVTGREGEQPTALGPDHLIRPRLSLSHVRGHVACALSRDHAIGVDVERMRDVQVLAEAVRPILAPEESLALEGNGPEVTADRLLRIWTLKEAFVKATGTGLGGLPDVSLLRELSFDVATDPPAVRGSSALFGPSDRWTFRTTAPAADLRGAVAVRSRTMDRNAATIRVIDLREMELSRPS